MIASTTPRRAILSAVAFFGTLWILSVGYSAYSGLASASAWQGLTSAAWNQAKDNFDDLNSRLSNFSFAGGNVGIWTASPGAKLEIAGTMKASILTLSDVSSQGAEAGALKLNGGGGSITFDDGGQKRISWNDGGGNFNVRSGNYYQPGVGIAYAKGVSDSNWWAASMTMNTDGADGTVSIGAAPIGTPWSAVTWTNMFVHAPTVSYFVGGNVWIGTSAPSQKLEVTGIVYSTSGGFKFPDGTIQTTATTWGWVPTGAIMAFNLASCPPGWSEYVAARGRFLRGIDSTGANDSVRAAGNIQNDALGSHSHSFSLNWKNNNGIAAPGFVVWWSWLVWVQSYSTVAAWDLETRPKNVAVLYCVKN